jgi:hypothetical protein
MPTKLLTAGLAISLGLVLATGADAQDRRAKKRKVERQAPYGESYRSSTVDRNGLCRRDTGRPFHSLNLNHQCDREEFWARFNDYGNDRN